jgi:hypothetical protein
MKASSVILTIAVLAAATTTSADAQGRGRGKGNQGIPPGQRPPAGMCRIWINDVPPGQQPAPTDCASAVRNRPSNGKVLFGDEQQKGKKGKSEKGKSSSTDELVDQIIRRIPR